MKRIFPIVFLQFLLSAALFSQDKHTPFGEVTANDLIMERYDKDPAAEAVILFDEGISFFFDTEGSYDIRFTRTKRVKVFTAEGIQYASVNIPYYYTNDATEKVKSVEAYCYNIENGKITKSALNPENIYTEEINDKWKMKKFVIPNVREGSVFEYRYEIESPFKFNLPDWEFQGPIPTIISTYEVCMIPFYEYTFIAQGINKLDIQATRQGEMLRSSALLPTSPYGENGFRDLIHTYGMRDVPAFKDETYVSSISDYIMKIDFQLSKYYTGRGNAIEVMSTWPRLIADFDKNQDFGSFINRCGKYAQEAIDGLPEPLPDDLEQRCKVVVEYVKKNFNWNSYYGKYATQSPKEFVEKRSGNSAEINLFMIAMLEKAGLGAYPVILSTRDNGKIKTNYPFESFFNYVIACVMVNKALVLADGTEPLLAYNKVPTRCINEKGLIINKGKEDWLFLSDNSISKEMQIFNITPDPENLTASATVAIKASDYDAYSYKTAFANDSIYIARNMLEKGLTRISGLNTLYYNDPSKPYIINIKGESDIEGLNKQIYVKPFLNFPMGDNPLTQTTRSYPIDMTYASSVTFISYIDIPSGYKVSELPDNLHSENEQVNISIEYKTEGDKVIVTGNYTFRKAVYSPAEYSKLRFSINTIVKAFNKAIALEPN